MSEERRYDYQEMHNDIREIKDLLQNENGLFVRMRAAENRVDSLQSELTEHKKDDTKDNTLEKRVDRLDTRFWYLIGSFICSIFAFIYDKIK